MLKKETNKTIIKIFIFCFAALLSTVFLTSKINAATSSQFDLLPSKNPIRVGEYSDINVFLNSGDNKITQARIVLEFDPSVIEVVEANNSDLFCSYPTENDQYKVNNTAGFIKITGFCATAPVETQNTFKLFAKIVVKGLKAGQINIQAKYSAAAGIDETAIFDDKSPPQNKLVAQPSKVIFSVRTASGGVVPGTAISDWTPLIIGILLLSVFGGGFLFLKSRINNQKYVR